MGRLTVSLVIILATATPSLSWGQGAQDARGREGLWWGVGLGYGWSYVFCDICDAYRDRGLTATGRIGGTLSRSVLLGAELNGWTRGEEEVDEYLGSISVAAYWYPNPTGGFYLKGGLSYVGYRIDDGEDALTSTGFGPVLGFGYDFRVGSFSLQPYVNTVITFPTCTLDLNGDRQADGVSLALIHAGLVFHRH